MGQMSRRHARLLAKESLVEERSSSDQWRVRPSPFKIRTIASMVFQVRVVAGAAHSLAVCP